MARAMRYRSLLGSLTLVALVACGEAEVAPPKTPEPASTAGAVPSSSVSTVATTPPPAPSGHAPKAPVALEEYFKIRRVPAFSRSGLPMLSFSADESKVAYASDETGRIDIWVKPV